MRARVIGFGTSTLLHGTIFLIVIWPVLIAALLGQPNGRGTSTARSTPTPVTEIVTVSPDELNPNAPDDSEREREARRRAADDTPEDLGIELNEGPRNPAFNFNVAKVVTRAASLYPFLTRKLRLDPPRRTRRDRNGLINPFGLERLARPPLHASGEELQMLLDKSWSRRERWGPFQPIAAIASHFDPNEGQLPILLRGYVTQNGLQPYVDDGTRDGRMWVQLGLAADHSDFIDFITRYAEMAPSTKASTELLFLLEKLAEANLDALVTLLDIDAAHDLRWTQRAHPAAYVALDTIQQHYRRHLIANGLASRKALADHYDRVRLQILRAILRHTPQGYRAADARFLVGAMHWKRHETAEALRVWQEMRVGSDDEHGDAAVRVLVEIRAAAGKEIERRRIDRIIDAEQGRWIVRSQERLRSFGYRFDTY